MYDNDTFEHDGMSFRVTFPRDDFQREPWTEEDGHGSISNWLRHAFGQGTKPPKAPGERILVWDCGSYRTYDFAEACKIALRDGWGATGDEGMKPHQKAAHAAEADFKRLRAWCNNDWTYVGVVVELLDDESEPTGETESLWGVESDADDYLDECAHELAAEIIANLQSRAA
jgi:hypothetical protein